MAEQPIFDILKHNLVPKHFIISEEEKIELLDKYKITKEQLPKILNVDPVVKILDAKEGDIIRIERNSPTAGKINYYRLVIKKIKKIR